MSEKCEDKIKYKYILPPCPLYDIEGMESWLSDMALNGLILSKDGFFCGFAIFEKTNPCSMRYRLEAAPKNASMWSDNGDSPTHEALELTESYGWKYVATRGQFYIYCTKDTDVRELNTDPKVQALALDLVRKREKSKLVSGIIWFLVFVILQLKGKLLILALHSGSWFALLSIIIIVWSFIDSVSSAIELKGLYKKLSLGETPNHRKDWKRKANWHRVSGILFLSLAFLWLAFLLYNWGKDISDEDVIPLEEYNDSLPFATIKDLAPNGEYSSDDFYKTNTIKVNSDWLAPIIIEYRETGSVKLENNQYIKGGLFVNYYETVSPWIAREVAREYKVGGENSKYYEKLELTDLDVDYATAYIDTFPTLVIQNGNKIMHITFYQTSESYTVQLDEWAQVFVDSLK